jgi:hypothetical protein
VQDSPNLWHRDLDYEIPSDEQQELIVKHLGADFFERATRYLRAGKAGARR